MAPVTEQEGQGLGDKARRSEDDAEEAKDDADEEEEDEADANAPSHLPLAPHSDSEILDATTTVDPSYIISLIRQLLPYDSSVEKQSKVADSDMQKEFGKGEINAELDDRKPLTEDKKEPREDCGCILWDLAATEWHAELMVQNLILEVLVASLHATGSFRLKTAARLQQLRSKAVQASGFVCKHVSAYYKELLEKNKHQIVQPANIEKCQELSKQLFYTRLARSASL